MTPDNKGRTGAWIVFLTFLGIFLVVFLFYFDVYKNHWMFEWPKAAIAMGGLEFANTLGAFVIGALGSWAFMVGVNVGLVARSQRETILTYLTGQYTWQALFVMFGGLIAAVFQLGQARAFAPIQALVIGATWPSVLSQYLSGQGSSTGDTTSITAQLATRASAASASSAPAGQLLTSPAANPPANPPVVPPTAPQGGN